jgi:lysophospholipase L1-like esterase
MRKIVLLTLFTFTIIFISILEVYEYKYSDIGKVNENQSVNRYDLEKENIYTGSPESYYKSYNSDIEFKFSTSRDKNEWLREMKYIQNNSSYRMQTAHDKIEFLEYDKDNLYYVNYTGDIKDKSAKKILLIGDSFVAGYAQERYNLNYFSILKDKLEKNEYLNKYEIFSVGKSGSFYSYLTALDYYYDKVKPDLVIIGFLSNDYIPDPTQIESIEYLSCIYGNNLLFSTIDKIPSRYEFTKERIKDYFCNKALTEKIKMKEDLNASQKLFETGLSKLKNKYDYKDFIIANTEPPILFNHSFALEEFKKKKFNLINMSNTYNLLGYTNSKELYINPFDWHPAPNLSNAYADDIFNYLLENHPHEKRTKPEGSDNSLVNTINAKISKSEAKNIFTIEKIVSLENFNEIRYKNPSVISSTNDVYEKKQYPLQLSFCAKLNRPYDIYEFEKSGKYSISLDKSEHESLFIINYYLENGKYKEEYNLLKNGSSIDIAKDSMGFMVATPYSGCDLDETIDTGLYKIKITF